VKLRVVAVSSPEYLTRPQTTSTLDSTDPFSLFNAIRVCVYSAQNNVDAWKESNWNTKNFSELRDSIKLYRSLEDDLLDFTEMLLKYKPNILLIGCMSISFIGGIELIKIARNLLKKDVCIIVGGKHINETVFFEGDSIKHLNNSPLNLIDRNLISDNLIDFTISGQAEFILEYLGIKIGGSDNIVKAIKQIKEDRKADFVSGNWILSWFDIEEKNVKNIYAKNNMEWDKVVTPLLLFGVQSSFNVFGENVLTGHISSDLSQGCIYDCNFCSERSSVNRMSTDFDNAPKRLFGYMSDALSFMSNKYNREPTVFIEDSIFLGGIPKLIEDFCNIAIKNNLYLKFGCQFTLDLVIKRRDLLEKLYRLGLQYVFVGAETIDENISKKMSKNILSHKDTWESRIFQALKILDDIGIKSGVSVLFGLGEDQTMRIELLQNINKMQIEYNFPHVISMNWATLHPLQRNNNFDYLDWGTPKGELHDIFNQYFGEASLEYAVEPNSINLPHIKEIVAIYKELI